jgi:hypothetical protein
LGANEQNTFYRCRPYQLLIQCREWQSLALRQFEINSIIEAQPVPSREREDGGMIRKRRMIDGKSFNDSKEAEGVVFGQAPSALSL